MASEQWQALVEGQWTVVQTADSQGRRYLLAKRNTGRTPSSMLNELEAKALDLRAQGYAFKQIAYELARSPASACELVTSGMKKLGIRHDLELAQLLLTPVPASVEPLVEPKEALHG